MVHRRFLPAVLVALSLSGAAGARAATPPAGAAALTPAFHPGAAFGNVFSRTIAIRAPGFDELVSTRPVTLTSARLGRIEATERQYILLNAMPVEAPVVQTIPVR